MSGTLIVWKSPHSDGEDDAARLLSGYHATGDESAFEPSGDVTAFLDEVLELWPPRKPPEDVGTAPSWSSTPERSDRIVSLDYSWSAPDELLDDIDRIARKHALVLYDPQGPSLRVPGVDGEPAPVDGREVARVTAIGLG